MEPGRELDKLVAEAMALKIYNYDTEGYHPYQGQHDWLNNRDNYPHITIDKERLALWVAPDTDGKEWAPSTDWAAAGLAWEWLEKNNPWYPCWLTLERSKYGKPSVGISCNDGGREIEGESYPHVIALAVVESTKIKETLT